MMVDLETLGSGNDAAIVQIGAVRFNPYDYDGDFELWKQNVSLESSVAAGGQMDPATVLWWMHQPQEARESVFPIQEERRYSAKDVSDAIGIEKALRELSRFYQGSLGNYTAEEKPPACEAVWAHATFDPVVLASAYRRSKIALPWSFRDVRDLRTIIALAAPEVSALAYARGEVYGPRHDALADALRQILVVRECYRYLLPPL